MQKIAELDLEARSKEAACFDVLSRTTVEVIEFDSQFQKQVEELVLPIQTQEFGVKITREEQPDLLDVKGVFQKENGNFWVVLRDSEVVGTIGVVDIGNRQLALKKMFVRQDARGKGSGVAQALMDKAISWAQEKKMTSLFLGTTSQMLAAHRFYEKNGFVEQQVEQLPPNFPIVHVDTKFYRLDLPAAP